MSADATAMPNNNDALRAKIAEATTADNAMREATWAAYTGPEVSPAAFHHIWLAARSAHLACTQPGCNARYDPSTAGWVNPDGSVDSGWYWLGCLPEKPGTPVHDHRGDATLRPSAPNVDIPRPAS